MAQHCRAISAKRSAKFLLGILQSRLHGLVNSRHFARESSDLIMAKTYSTGAPMTDDSKRELLKKAAYIAPAILTFKTVPTYAQSGSGRAARAGETGNNGVKQTVTKPVSSNRAGAGREVQRN
jgi:hypothetical protein